MAINHKPRLLDLFCGAGGAAMGYHRAGFEVVGVDINPQSHYPFEFHQGDALTWLAEHRVGNRYYPRIDAIHASPPCQAYSAAHHSQPRKRYPELIEPTRRLLIATGLPYVIENVERAPLLNPTTLCGATFRLTTTDDDGKQLFLKRHRLFESNVFLLDGSGCQCRDLQRLGMTVGGVYGGGPQNRANKPWEGYEIRRGGYTPSQHVRVRLMDINWMTQWELTQAIPPAYTEWIGKQLMAALKVAV